MEKQFHILQCYLKGKFGKFVVIEYSTKKTYYLLGDAKIVTQNKASQNNNDLGRKINVSKLMTN